MKIAVLVAFSLCPLVVATAFVSFHKPIIGKSVAGKDQGPRAPQAVNPHIIESYGKLPLSFEANQGQTDVQVKFISRGSGYSLFLTSTEAVLNLQGPQTGNGPLRPAPSTKLTSVLRMKLVGANPSPQLTGRDELPGKSNYFIGNDPEKWRTNVPNYEKVKYAEVYSGIDLVYYGNQRQLEYDFVVSPGADPRAIRVAIDGDERRRIDGQGDLVLGAAGSELRLRQPVIYQEINGARKRIGGNFVIQGGQIGFEVARYDASKPLIIDPVLSYSTYLGGNNGDVGSGIAVDASGNAYVTGSTDSLNFPTANPFQAAYSGDESVAFVTKLNVAGSALVYSTYLGGSSSDWASGIAVDSSGNAYVTGSAYSTDFPITTNAFQAAHGGGTDAFVTKLNAAGSALVYSTYLGGNYFDYGGGIAVDSSGNTYVTGTASSTNFPTANALQAAGGGMCGTAPLSYPCYEPFVTKLNAAGSALVYSTYLGGVGDDASGIAVDSFGYAYVTGTTSSANFPTTPGAFQTTGGGCFVTKFSPSGTTLAYSTLINNGGCIGIAVDSSGDVYVTGSTNSPNFPTTAGAFQKTFSGGICGAAPLNYPCDDSFVTKLNVTGSALVYSTYLGGSGRDDGSAIAVDSSGNVYVTGITSSTDFPTANAFQGTFAGGCCSYNGAVLGETFVTELNAAGSTLVYSTYLGSHGGGLDDGPSGIAVDASGNAYVAGYSTSPNFPTTNAFQPGYGGGNYFGGDALAGDAFVTKFPAVAAGPDPWQQAITAMKTAAGTDSANFWQWAWYWQRSPAFPGAPSGFGVLVSIDNIPGLIDKIVAAGGGNGFQMVSAEQWVLDYRQAAQSPDPWQQAITAMKTAAGTDSANFWQWAWFWQRTATFAGEPTGFGVLGSIDNTPGLIDKIVAAGGGNGFQIVSAEQWMAYYRQAASQ